MLPNNPLRLLSRLFERRLGCSASRGRLGRILPRPGEIGLQRGRRLARQRQLGLRGGGVPARAEELRLEVHARLVSFLPDARQLCLAPRDLIPSFGQLRLERRAPIRSVRCVLPGSSEIGLQRLRRLARRRQLDPHGSHPFARLRNLRLEGRALLLALPADAVELHLDRCSRSPGGSPRRVVLSRRPFSLLPRRRQLCLVTGARLSHLLPHARQIAFQGDRRRARRRQLSLRPRRPLPCFRKLSLERRLRLAPLAPCAPELVLKR